MKEAIKKQEQIIKEENDKLELLKHFDINNIIDEEYFYQLCRTPLRDNSEIMCNIISNIFPMSTEIKNKGNVIYFNIKGFEISIQTRGLRGLNVNISSIPNDNFYHEKYGFGCDKSDINFLKDYIKMIDDKSSWYKKALSRDGNRHKKIGLFFWWFFKITYVDKKSNRNREWFVAKLDELIEVGQTEYNVKVDEYNKFVKKWSIYFNEVEEILLAYSKCIRCYDSDFFDEARELVNKGEI